MAQEGGQVDQADERRSWEILNEHEPDRQARQEWEAAKAARRESEQS